tara:strand:- start:65 stop:898 length:834 start_codon:yes stop_codon:yes gene_type:complete
MNNYKCLRCGFKTDRIYNFKKHLNRKFICKPKLSEISIKDIIKHYNLYNYSKQDVKEIENNLFECNFCNKKFCRKDALKRHLRNRCKKKVYNNDTKKKMRLKLEDMFIEIYKMQQIIDNQNKIINKNIKKSIINKNKITNDVKVNNFGNENLNYLNEKVYKKILAYPKTSIPRLIRKIHFNPNHPENHNVRIKNKKLKWAEIRENNEWRLRHKKKVLDDLVDFGYITLEEFKDSIKNLDKLLKIGFNNMLNEYDNSKKSIIGDVELEVLNGTKSLKL